MDKILIHGLEVNMLIGVYDWEQTAKQTLFIDLVLYCDITEAAATDKLEYALDYDAISKSVTHFLEQEHFQLIEAAAEAVAQLIQKEFSVVGLSVQISKPGAVANAKNLSVYIERGQL